VTAKSKAGASNLSSPEGVIEIEIGNQRLTLLPTDSVIQWKVD
jgi:hypothetical protein